MKKISMFLTTMAVSTFLVFCLSGCFSNGSKESVSTESATHSETVYVMKERSTLLGNYEYSDPEFDEHGNLVQITENNPKEKNWTNTITFEYSDDGKLQKRTDSIDYDALYDDYVITVTYDENGEATKVESTRDQERFPGGVPADYVVGLVAGDYSNAYNEQGQLVERTKDDLVIKYEYNDEGQLVKSITYEGPEESSSTTYVYDENGNLIREDVVVDDSSWSTFYTYESTPVEVIE